MTGRRVAIVGPGRVGTLLALALPRAGHRIVAVVGGSKSSQERFAATVAGSRFVPLADATERADLVILSTPDAAVGSVVRAMAVDDLVGEEHRVVHLAGSLGLAPLRPVALAGAGVAAIHPAQTIPGDAAPEALIGAAWAVTAAASNRDWAHALVRDLGGDAHDVAEEDRVLYHAALVLGSNAVGAALSAARQLLLAARVEDPAAFLGALARSSSENVLAHGATALTGPVVRGDVETLERHLAALDADLPELGQAYRDLQRAVLGQVRADLDEETAARVAAVLSRD